jgi:YVTN family beta-propeller protein
MMQSSRSSPKLFERAGLGVLALATLLWCAGCGDVFRPVATPVVGPGGDPQRLAHAVVVFDNGGNPGSVAAIDASGDTNVGTVSVGRAPVHASAPLNSGRRTVISNRDDDTVALYSAFSPTASPLFITLPTGARPVFAASTENIPFYVAESGTNKVAVISQATSALSAEVDVGTKPVALAETADGKKVYAVNQASNDVSVIATIDRSVGPPIAVGSAPVWAVLNNDSSLLFVVNQGSNNVSVISTSTDAVVATIGVGAGPNYAFFDGGLRRVYVTSPAGNSLSIIDATTATPSLIATVPVMGGACNGSGPVSVTALSDGSRAYVANNGSNNVCVLVSINNSFVRSIAVGIAPVSIASATDGTKVFVANQGSQDITDIKTADDTVAATVPAPQQDFNCVVGTPAGNVCPRQTPVYVAMAP